MKIKKPISDAVVRRMPRYYRCLKELERAGVKRVSSTTISEILNITASQVRQDFSNFGEFGQQGYGYDLVYLKAQIRAILGLDKEYGVVIVGGGHIGLALANYEKYSREGFRILAVFDVKFDHIKAPRGVEILHIDEFEKFVEENKVDICAITTQKETALSIAEKAKECGISAIWNFAPIDIHEDDNTVVENLNLNESLFTLCYKLNAKELEEV
ncbi:MAG: redox-sensing transcriptional repressor Rex [Bacillota bacterium]